PKLLDSKLIEAPPCAAWSRSALVVEADVETDAGAREADALASFTRRALDRRDLAGLGSARLHRAFRLGILGLVARFGSGNAPAERKGEGDLEGNGGDLRVGHRADDDVRFAVDVRRGRAHVRRFFLAGEEEDAGRAR